MYRKLLQKHYSFVNSLKKWTWPISFPTSYTPSYPSCPCSCAGGGPCTIHALWGPDYVFSSKWQAKDIVKYVFKNTTTCKELMQAYKSSMPLRHRNCTTCVQWWSNPVLFAVAVFLVLLTQLLKIRALPIFSQLLHIIRRHEIWYFSRLLCIGKHVLQLFSGSNLEIPPDEAIMLRQPVVILLKHHIQVTNLSQYV